MASVLSDVKKSANHPRLLKNRQMRVERTEKLKVIVASNQSPSLRKFITRKAAGFTNDTDSRIFRCQYCLLELSMDNAVEDLYEWHAEQRPDCKFVRDFLNSNNTKKNQVMETDQILIKQNYYLYEPAVVKQARMRSFSKWPSKKRPTVDELTYSGFFCCNVNDRTICIYCNKIFQGWKSTDDPIAVHRTYSPHCPYVIWMQNDNFNVNRSIINENNDGSSANLTAVRSKWIDYSSPSHPRYSDVTARLRSFESWQDQTAPSVDLLVKAGFFYSGVENIVTCFYCSGSLQRWGPDDNPSIEHYRWFENCLYAKQLCGEELCRKIRLAKKIQQERNMQNQTSEASISSHSPLIDNQDFIQRCAAARLDLPVAQYMLDSDCKLAVIRRCFEDQLKKGDDFAHDEDLILACIILEKQIEYIKGNIQNIIIPSENRQENAERTILEQPGHSNSSNSTAIITRANTQDKVNARSESKVISKQCDERHHEKNSVNNNPNSDKLCVICSDETRQIACVPCGHLITCVSCGHSVKICPICKTAITAFIRIYT